MKIFYRLALIAIIGFAMVDSAAARTIVVTTAADLAPAIDGSCSLREALSVANGSTLVDAACGGLGDPGLDVISLAPDTYAVLLPGPNVDSYWGDLDIYTEVQIIAPSGGAIIEAAPFSKADGGRVIEVHPGASLVLKNVIITGGNEATDGGGILNNGRLYLDNVKVIDNRSSWSGGGIASYGGSELYLLDSAVWGNISKGVTSAVFNGGGGIWLAASARASIIRSTLSDNEAYNIGGGILSFTSQASGGSLAIENSTISGNLADIGGGIYHNGTALFIDYVTISNNTGTVSGGGLVSVIDQTVILRNSILAGNLNGDSTPDCSGRMKSHGYNIVGILDAGCVLLDPLNLSSDQSGTTATPLDPLISVLADHGGPTLTHDIAPGSPALDAGHPNTCKGTDQRSYIRPSGPGCDIGATEFQYAASRYVVDSNADDGTGCTLRDALQSVMNGTPEPGCKDLGSLGVDTIEFTPAVTGTINLASDLPAVNRSLHLIGPGSRVLTIDGQGAFPSGLYIDDPGNATNVVVEDIAFRDGFSSPNAAVFYVASYETLELKGVLIDQNEANGGCVIVNGNLILSNSTISNCAGRGVSVVNGTLDISDSVISDNVSSLTGGGVHLQASTMMARDSVFSGNEAVQGGGGLNVNSGNLKISIERSTFSGNTADYGAGIQLANGDLSIVDSAVTGNSTNSNAGGNGGGISVNGLHAHISIANSTISGNSTLSYGGGLALLSGSADIANVTITDNVSDADASGNGNGGGIFLTAPATISMRNSILSGNRDLNAAVQHPDCYKAPIVSGGFNLVGSASGCPAASWSSDDIIGAELLLLSLADNGGPTLTHAILPPSPAVDGVDSKNGCFWDHDLDSKTADVALNMDQRARRRYTDGNNDTFRYCDIGAFEFDPVSDAGLWSTSSTLGVELAGTGSGTVTSAPVGIKCGTDCYHIYKPATQVTLTPRPVAGSYFSRWSGDADCLDGSVTTSAAVSCVAIFMATQRTLTVTLAGNGTGSVSSSPAGISCPGDCSEVYNSGSTVTLTPTADPGWLFAGWSGDEDCLDGVVNMNNDLSCTAWFADAQGYTVTSNLDDNGAGCTLREALQSVMSETPAAGCFPVGAPIADTIDFAASVTGAILLDSELPEVDQALRILGPGSGVLAIDGQGTYRSGLYLKWDVGGPVLIQDLTFRNGLTAAGGGALGITNNTLELRDVKLINNRARTGGAVNSYGGGSLTISNSLFSGNSADTSPTGTDGSGGAIRIRDCTMSVSSTEFSDNSAPYDEGGAIWIDNSSGESVTIEGVTFSGNDAKRGGAMHVISGRIAIRDSLFHNNAAIAWQGGALKIANTANPEVSIANSTFSGNSAVKVGGAIEKNGGVLKLANVTLSNNTTDDTYGGGGIMVSDANGIVIRNSIISGNHAPNAAAGRTDMACVSSGTVISEDYNLIGDMLGCAPFTPAADDLVGVDPLLDSLADNGGTTMTHRLLAGSPAIDGGNPFNGCHWDDDANTATVDVNLTSDQRGANRYADGDGDTYNVCDAGAYEYDGVTIDTIFAGGFEGE